jgi:hypothetical protein
MDSPIVMAAIKRDMEQQTNLKIAIAKSTQTTLFKLNDPPEPSRRVSKLALSTRETELTEEQQPATIPASVSASTAPAATATKFDYNVAYRKILRQLSINPSPLGKLRTVFELEMLAVSSLSTTGFGGLSTPGSFRSHRTRSNMTSFSSETPGMARPTGTLDKPTTEVRNAAGAALTSIGETIATVEAKRSSSGAFVGQFLPRAGPNTDAIAEELSRILKSTDLKSGTLFRDLQFIAAFVPPHVLDLTDLGKAFWDVSLAALSLKEEALELIADTATEIFQYKTGMISNGIDGQFLSQWTLADCAWLWSIASKEGDVTGQRELGIMHMSHPEITPITLLPFAKISDVFGPILLDDPRLMDDLDKYDPVRMAVIKHWMSSAASFGDAIANEYLVQQHPSGYI